MPYVVTDGSRSGKGIRVSVVVKSVRRGYRVQIEIGIGIEIEERQKISIPISSDHIAAGGGSAKSAGRARQ